MTLTVHQQMRVFPTCTAHLATKAAVGRLDDRSTEYGPLGLNVPCFPRDMDEALPEVGVEAPSDGGLCQAFPADPHNMFGSARSHWHPPPPSEPTCHQMVVG